ncbi:putative glycosidase CRH2 [Coemansia sp. IMI 209128]|nr:putative glycosidase CRH2 [Coemansia sp. RSA 2530]KAJ2698797.1 putative glycosidase CRH2 [Coemansia sp. IMI 209128]
MKNITFATIALAALVQTALAAGKCGTQTCSQSTPCCVGGYCNSNAQYCMPILCEAANSFSPSSCWNTAHCVKSNVAFGSPNAFAQIADYDGNPADAAFVSQFEPSNAKVVNGELQMALVKQNNGAGFGATVIGTRAFQYGTVTAVMRSGCASGGVVSSFIIRNEKVGDEIDFEFVGADTATVQSNYYWHNQLDYTKMVKSPALSDTTLNYHTYQIQWTPDQIVWLVNGNAFRTVKRSDTWDAAANTFKYPDSESYISVGIWDGGSGAKGTADWAGGAIQWNKQPFVAAVKSITIDCYYNGNETTYVPPGGNGGSSSSAGSSTTASPTSTSSGSSSSGGDSGSGSSSGGGSSNGSSGSKTGSSASSKATSSASTRSSKSAPSSQSESDSSVDEDSGSDSPSSSEDSSTGNGAGSLAASFGVLASALLAAYVAL